MNFRKIELSDRGRIEEILLPLKRNDSPLAFANLFSLQEKYGTTICIEEDTLFIRQKNQADDGRGCSFYIPFGKMPLQIAVKRLLSAQLDSSTPLRFVNASESDRSSLEAAFPGCFSFSSDRSFSEYLYRSADLATLEGHELAKRRRERKKFAMLFGERTTFEKITNSTINGIREFQFSWYSKNAEKGNSSHPIELEHKKILLDLDIYDKLNLEGIAMRIDGKIEGYSYGCMLSGGAFDVMVMKTNSDFIYSWRALLQETARSVQHRAEHLNLEEDLGIPGMRQCKMGYRPIELINKYQAVQVAPFNIICK